MPFYEAGGAPLGEVRGLPTEPIEAEEPTTLETLGAAFRSENTVGSVITRLVRGGEGTALGPFGDFAKRDFDPFDGLEEKYLPHAGSFVTANSPEESAAIKRRLDLELEDREIVARSGAGGMAATFAAGLIDPLILVPIGGPVAAGARGGVSVLRGGLATAKAGFVGATAAEAVLSLTQDTRTLGESAINIAAGTFLAGVLGGLAVPVGRAVRGRRGRRTEPVEARVEREMEIPPEHLRDPVEPGFVPVTRAELVIDLRQAEARAAGREFEVIEGGRGGGRVFEPGERSIDRFVDDVLGPDDLAAVKAGDRVTYETPDGARVSGTVERIIESGETGQRVAVIALDEGAPSRTPVRARRADGSAVEATPRPLTTDIEPKLKVSLSDGGRVAPDTNEAGLTGRLVAGETGGRIEAEAVGAAATPRGPVRVLGIVDEKLAGAYGIEKLIGARGRKGEILSAPIVQIMRSPSVDARLAGQMLADTPFFFEKNALGIETPASVETLTRLWQTNLNDAIEEIDAAFVKMRTGGAGGAFRRAGIQARDLAGPRGMTFREFKEEIGKAMRRGDEHAVPEVAEAARTIRERLFEPLKEAAIEAGLLPEDVAVETAISYLTRVYNVNKINAERNQFVGVVERWLGAQQMQARERTAAAEARVAAAEREVGETLREAETTRKREQEARGKEKKARTTKVVAERDAVAAEREMRQAARQAADLQRRLDRFAEGEISRKDVLAIIAEIKKAPPEDRAAFADALDFARLGIDVEKMTPEKILARLREIAAQPERAARGRVREAGTQARAAGRRLSKAEDRAERAAIRATETADAVRVMREMLSEARARFDDASNRLGKANAKLAKARKAADSERLFAELDGHELREIAEGITDQVTGAPNGRVSYETMVVPLKRGPTMERTFSIPDELIEPWLESDIELVSRFYHRTMAPDVELAKAFGSTTLDGMIRNVREEYQAMFRRAGSDAERKKLTAERDQDIKIIGALRDRLRGTYTAPDDPNSVIVRSSRIIRQLNLLRLLGGMTVSAFPDVARPVMVEGYGRVFGGPVRALVEDMQGFKLAASEVKLAGQALEMTLNSRAMSLADLGDDFGRHSKFERGLEAATNNFGMVSIMAPWNTFWKQFSGITVASRILDTATAPKRVPDDIRKAAASGLGRDMLDRIAAQFREHGETREAVRIANTGAWTDRDAVTAFRAAVNLDTDRMIVTPGIGDRPLWISHPVGQVIGQFRSFSFASATRITMSGLQQGGMATLNGFALSVMAGMAVYAFKTSQFGAPLSDDPAKWIAEGIDRSGVMGWFYDVNNILEKTTRGTVGVNAVIGGPTSSRYASRNTIGAIFGPTPGMVTEVAGAIGAIGASAKAGIEGDPRQQFSRSDVRAFRRLLPYQNLFYLRWALNKAEDGVSDTLGLPERRPRR